MAILMIIFAIGLALGLLIFLVAAASRPRLRIVEKPRHIVWEALNDEELQSYLPDARIEAIKRYRELTAAGLKEALEVIDWIVANPDDLSKGKPGTALEVSGAGVRDLIAAGEIEEAVRVYAAFMGVDQFSAREAVEAMQHDLSAEMRLSAEIADLLAEGRKAEAIKVYQDMTGAGLAEAKAAVERFINHNTR